MGQFEKVAHRLKDVANNMKAADALRQTDFPDLNLPDERKPNIVQPPRLRVASAHALPESWIILAHDSEWMHVWRCWSKEAGVTAVCHCGVGCPSRRLDHYCCGLVRHLDFWERCILSFPQAGYDELRLLIETGYNGDAKGMNGRWRRIGHPNYGRVEVKVNGRASGFRVSSCSSIIKDLAFRLRSSENFMTIHDHDGQVIDSTGQPTSTDQPFSSDPSTATNSADTVEPAQITGKKASNQPRSKKPRVSKGCGPCHKSSDKHLS